MTAMDGDNAATPLEVATRAPPNAALGGLGALRSSVVKIFVRSVGNNFTSPWNKRPQRSSTGSGLCIDCQKRYVLTNAHVVASAVSVRVRRHGDAIRYLATVLCVSPQCDLALLEVRAEEFWSGVTAIELTDAVPPLDSDVLTIGYPMGGDNISVTRGVVSRVDLMDYTFSPVAGERLPVIQVDAAINPGNSGGPVLDAEGRAIGVAFAGLGSGENIGYVIPGFIALFFLRSYAVHGLFVGLCSLGIRVQSTQGTALRQFHQLDGQAVGGGNAGDGGVLVVAVAPLSPAAKAGLRAGDVLLSVDGVQIGEDSSVPFREDQSGERIGFDFLVTRKTAGEKISVGVRASRERAGNGLEAAVTQTLSLQATPIEKLVPRTEGVDAQPSYLVVGGLVFVPLTLPWLEQRFQRMGEAPPELLQKLEEFKQSEDEEVVVLAKVLSAEVNYGFEDFSCLQLAEFGSYASRGGAGAPEDSGSMVKVRSLRHLRELVQAATRSGYLRFRLASDLEVVLNAAECEAARDEILRQHAIPRDCSDDLLAPSGRQLAGSSRL